MFTSAPFTADTALVGSIQVQLLVMTNATDTDFVVRVTDAYPDAQTSMLLTDNVVRMRWRDGDVIETPTTPNKPYLITLKMWELAYVFNIGHALRVSITSSNYPRYSVNPNNGLPVVANGTILVASNSIILGQSSFVSIPTVPISALPKFS